MRVRIERVMRITSPEEAERHDRDAYLALSYDERLAFLMELRNEWTAPDHRRLKRTLELVRVPRR